MPAETGQDAMLNGVTADDGAFLEAPTQRLGWAADGQQPARGRMGERTEEPRRIMGQLTSQQGP
jgi:hypothetical protein